MLADIQDAVVEHLRTQADGAPESNHSVLLPSLVRSYGGEMHDVHRLAKLCPVVFVEFENAILNTLTMGGTGLSGTETVHIICCALNQASGQATANDGVRLLSWAALAMSGFDVQIGTGQTVGVERLGVQRLLSGERVWAAALTAELDASGY